jgi:dihydrofolate reductase
MKNTSESNVEVSTKAGQVQFRSIWFVGGGTVAAECLRLGLADEICYSIVPVLISEGISFFGGLGREIALHLTDVRAYNSGMVELRYGVRGVPGGRAAAQPGC